MNDLANEFEPTTALNRVDGAVNMYFVPQIGMTTEVNRVGGSRGPRGGIDEPSARSSPTWRPGADGFPRTRARAQPRQRLAVHPCEHGQRSRHTRDRPVRSGRHRLPPPPHVGVHQFTSGSSNGIPFRRRIRNRPWLHAHRQGSCRGPNRRRDGGNPADRGAACCAAQAVKKADFRLLLPVFCGVLSLVAANCHGIEKESGGLHRPAGEDTRMSAQAELERLLAEGDFRAVEVAAGMGMPRSRRCGKGRGCPGTGRARSRWRAPGGSEGRRRGRSSPSD